MNNKKSLAAALLITSMVGSFTSLPTPIYADGNPQQGVTEQTPVNMGSLGKEIRFSGENTVTLKNVYLIPVDNGQILYTTLEVNNKSLGELDFYPYWMKMQSKSGGKFPVSTADIGKSQKVLPGSKQTFSYFALVPGNLKLTDLSVNLIKWDFSMPNYERGIYSFSLPDSAVIPQIAKDKSHVVDIQGIPVSLTVNNVRVSSSLNSKSVKMNLSFFNQGLRPVKLPAYEYALKGKDGYVYPVSMKTEGVINTLPRIKQDLELSVQIPADADISQYSLVVSEPSQSGADSEGKPTSSFSVPVASFELSTESGGGSPVVGNTKLGEIASIQIDNLDFDISIANVKTLPSSTFEKMISYEVTVKNMNNKKVALPKLNSYIKIGSETPILTSKKEIAQTIESGGETTVTMWGSLPGDINFNKMLISFQKATTSTDGTTDQSEETLEEDLAVFEVFKRSIETNETTVVQPYHFSDLGLNSTIAHRSTRHFDYWGSEILVSTFLVENKDTRPIRIPQYEGFYMTAEGEVITAELIKSTTRTVISPKRSAVITYWTELPKGMDYKNLDLVIGKPIAGKTTDEPEDLAVTLLESANFQVVGETLPSSQAKHFGKNDTFTYDMFPYIFSVKNLKLSTSGSIGAEFDFEQSFTPNVIPDGEPRKLSFEIVDEEGMVLDKVGTDTKWDAIDVESIESGNNIIKFDISGSKRGLYGLKVNVYELFKDGKNKIATFSLEF